MNTINHTALKKLIETNNWWFTASELHGILSALCALNQNSLWNKIITVDFESSAYETLIPELMTRIDDALRDNSLSYQLLLPEDSDIEKQAHAITNWAQGFYITHQYLKENNINPALDDGSNDFLGDVEAITQLDCNIQASPDNEALLNHLEEHLRMGTLLIYAETHHKI